MEVNFRNFGILCVIMIFMASSGHAENQTLWLYKEPYHFSNPNASYVIYTENVVDLTKSNLTFQAACAKTIGLWMYYTEPDYVPANMYGMINNLNDDTPCATTTYPIKSIRHVGHTDITKSAISLYNSTAMTNGNELYFDGYFLVLPYAIKIESYGFTGNINWTIGSESDVVLNNTCLALASYNKSNSVAHSTAGAGIITFKQNITLNTKSIRRGCMGNGSETLFPEYYMSDNNLMPGKINDIGINSPGLNLSVIPAKETADDGMIMMESGQLIFIGEKLVLIELLEIQNYSFIGEQKRNWTIHSEINLTGNKTCLIHGSTMLNETADVQPLRVGAITVGCDTDPEVSASSVQVASFNIIALAWLSCLILHLISIK